jgi:hypothetical protein
VARCEGGASGDASGVGNGAAATWVWCECKGFAEDPQAEAGCEQHMHDTAFAPASALQAFADELGIPFLDNLRHIHT